MHQKFIGRNNELSVLRNSLNQAKTGKGKLILIQGDSGMGKSGLAREFMHQLKFEKDLLLAGIECNDIENINAYAPFKDLIIQLNSNATNNKKDTLKKIKKFVGEAGSGWIGLIPIVGSFAATGLDTYKAYKETFKNDTSPTIEGVNDVYKIFEEELKRLTKDYTLVIFIDDLQWADTSSLNLLFALGKTIRSNPFKIVVIGSYRPSEINLGRTKLSENKGIITTRHPFADKLNELRNYLKKESHIPDNYNWFQEIRLHPFTLQEVKDLINYRFENHLFNDEFYQKIYNLTNGLPLFVIEILDYLLDHEIVQFENGKYSAKTLEINELPLSIQGVISEKVDRLDNDLKKVLTLASVNGKDFTLQIIEHISKIDEDELFDYLDDLIQKHQIVVEKDVENSLGDVFAFTQTLTQQFIYKNMSRARRKSLHRKIADFIKNNFNDKIEINKEIRDAYNYHNQVGQGLLDAFKPKETKEVLEKPSNTVFLEAAEIEMQNAMDNFNLFAIPECYDNIDKAMAFLSKVEDTNVEKHSLMFNCLKYRCLSQNYEGLYEQALKTALNLKNIAFQHLSKNRILDSYLFLGSLQKSLARYDEGLKTYREGLDMLVDSDDNDLSFRAEFLNAMADTNLNLSRYDIALEQMEESLQLTESSNDLQMIPERLKTMGNLYFDIDNYEQALKFHSKALKHNLENNYKPGIAGCYLNLGNVYAALDNISQAQVSFEKAREICTEINDAIGLSKIYNNLASIIEDHQRAIDYLQKALVYYETVDSKKDLSFTYGNLAYRYYLIEDFDNAITYYKMAITNAEDLDEKNYLNRFYNDIAKVYYDDGNYSKSVQYLEKDLLLKQGIFGEGSHEVDECKFELATSYYFANQKNKSKTYLLQSQEFRRTHYGEKSKEFQSISTLLEDLF